MGVDDADGLQVGIDDGTPHKFHPFPVKIFGNCVRERGGGTVCFVKGPIIGKVPDIAVERTVFLTYIIEYTGIGYGCLYLQAITDDTFVLL